MTNDALDKMFTPPPRDRSVLKFEDGACRAALKVARITEAEVRRMSGLDSGAYLSFAVLAAYTDFPVQPAVTIEPLDDVFTLMTRFEKSRLWRGWRDVWADRNVRPRHRLMVIYGTTMKYAVVHDSEVPPPRPHMAVGHRSGVQLHIEPLSSWCRGVEWAEPDSTL